MFRRLTGCCLRCRTTIARGVVAIAYQPLTFAITHSSHGPSAIRPAVPRRGTRVVRQRFIASGAVAEFGGNFFAT